MSMFAIKDDMANCARQNVPTATFVMRTLSISTCYATSCRMAWMLQTLAGTLTAILNARYRFATA